VGSTNFAIIHHGFDQINTALVILRRFYGVPNLIAIFHMGIVALFAITFRQVGAIFGGCGEPTVVG